LLGPALPNRNPVANLGRELFHPESYDNGGARALVARIIQLSQERGQMLVVRLLASNGRLQALFEQSGFSCVGFQPFKHALRAREGVLFYLRTLRPDTLTRLPVSESLSQVSELCAAVLSNLNFSQPGSVRDGVTGYPLQSELEFVEAPFVDYEAWRDQSQHLNPPIEVSGGFNLGLGLLRVTGNSPIRALLGQRAGKPVTGLAYFVDELDRCVRLVQACTVDDLSTATVLQRLVKLAQEKHNAVYIEADVLMTAPRLLKSAEQLGFVPVAYLPETYLRGNSCIDVVKMVKLNTAYGLEASQLTTHARSIVDIIDRYFQDQKIGVAIINLLRNLPIFDGLGDGELRKISRLFTQKLYRKDEKVFAKGESGEEAFVIMRGQVDIMLEDKAKPLASFGNGQIFGEMAFLEGSPRVAYAIASQPSILLVVQRMAFQDLVRREPHLGMVIIRNIAIELSKRLRRTNPPASNERR
jgi:hypothetical protein